MDDRKEERRKNMKRENGKDESGEGFDEQAGEKKNKLRKYFKYTLSSRLQVNILSYHDLFVQLLAISVKPLVNFFYIVLASD